MRLEQPNWWYGSRIIDKARALALSPAGGLYGLAAEARFAFALAYRSSLPVICAGNFTLGGAGKTPLAIAVAELARDWGGKPAFLTRGFGGRIEGPHRVDIARDKVADVGDEALLLARVAPTFVAHNRMKGARTIERAGIADIIIMDDGFQNPSLAKSMSVIAVDGAVGLGNRFIFPAGPLRAPLKAQLRRADVIVMVGEGPDLELPRTNTKDGHARVLPVLHARYQPNGDIDWLKTAPVVAFCGIGRPDKFFRTLEEAGADVKASVSFPDHHVFTAEDAASLLE
ncbi:MAG: tetraacyldisaccharide 4'-kinase, partial [Alphaproteobacteria bacterium]